MKYYTVNNFCNQVFVMYSPMKNVDTFHKAQKNKFIGKFNYSKMVTMRLYFECNFLISNKR